MPNAKGLSAEAERLAKLFTDRGLIIEAGWESLRVMWVAPDAGPEQVADLRTAFFAGAKHLFTSIITVMEDSEEANMARIDLIDAELKKFIQEFSNTNLKTQGSA